MIDPREKLPPLELPEEKRHTHKIVVEYHNDNAKFAAEIAQLVAQKKRAPNTKSVYREYVVRLSDNVPDGELRVYYPSGLLWSLESRKEGRVWSIDADFFPDGRPVEGFYLQNGKGRLRHFYSDGSVESEGDYEDGRKHGHWVYLYPNGKKMGEGTLARGEKTGLWKWYTDKGYLDATEECEEEGLYQKSFWPNAKLKSVGYYAKNAQGQNVKTAIWREYDERGKETLTEYDSNGKVIPIKKG